MTLINDEQMRLMHQMDESFREIRMLINTEWSKRENLGLNMTHGRMMVLLSEHGAMKASALAERLFITCGAVTGLSDKLIDLGYIEREKDKSDRRVVLLKLTELGIKKVNTIKQIRRNIMLKLFADLSMEEMQQGFYLFEKIRNNLIIANTKMDENSDVQSNE